MAGKFSITAIFKGDDQISKVIAGIGGSVSKFSSGVSARLKDVEKINGKIISGFADIAKKAAVVGAVVGGVGVAGLMSVASAGGDFEQAIANVGAVSLMTRDQVKDLEKAALQLGTSTKFSATQVAGGMELMGKAGFTNAEILQGIGPILSAAAAEGAEFEETAGHVSNVLKGMGLATSEAGRVADVLTLASARTNSSISSLGESMANVSSTARQFKIPLEQAVASVALLQDVGLDASVAGSAFNTMLTNMANPSAKAQASMAALGISFQDAKGNMLPLSDVFAQFDKASKKSGGNMKQVAFFAELVGLRGQKAAGNLGKLFTEGKFGDLVKELDAARGSAEKMAALRMNTFQGDLTLLGNAVDSVKIGLFDLESGPLRGVVQGVTKWMLANKALIVGDVQAFVKGLGENLPTIFVWLERISKVLFVFGVFALGIKSITLAMKLVGAANPWVLLLYGLVALTALVVAFWPEIKKHKEILGSTAFVVGLLVFAYKAQAMWTGIVAFATGGLTKAMELYSIATRGGAVASGIASAGLLPLLVALGAVALAIGAIYLAWTQFTDLLKLTGGWDGLKAGLGSFAKGDGLFKGVDEYQNTQARKAAADKTAAAATPAGAVPGMDFSAVLKYLTTAGTPAMPPVPAAPALPGMPAIPGMPPGQDPGAMLAGLVAAQHQAAGGAGANQAPQLTAKESGEAMAAAMAPMLSKVLADSKGEITIRSDGRPEVTKQTRVGSKLVLAPSGGI